MDIYVPTWMREITDPITRSRLISGYKADMRVQIKTQRAFDLIHPTICECEGGCDLGIAFSQ